MFAKNDIERMPVWCVYWTIDTEGKWYFGTTSGITTRMSHHNKSKHSGNYPLVTFEVLRGGMTYQQALAYEDELIKNLPCKNKIRPMRTEEEKKEYRKMKNKEFREKHPDYMKMYRASKR